MGIVSGLVKGTTRVASVIGICSSFISVNSSGQGRVFANAMSMSSSSAPSGTVSKITGLPPGPYPVGVTTVEVLDERRVDPGNPTEPKRLQTEIWYPAVDTVGTPPKNLFSDFLGRGVIPGSIEKANGASAIGGYRDGLTVEELDGSVWYNDAVRDADPRDPAAASGWPVVLFSHGSGAYRASYIYWTEYLASHGYVVAAPDHPGSARYTQVGGEVILPGGKRSGYDCMARERPLDMISVLDALGSLRAPPSTAPTASVPEPTALHRLLSTRSDCHNTAVTGMSFGGSTAALVLERNDPRIRAAVLQCPALRPPLATPGRANRTTPVMVMVGSEDTVIGSGGNRAARDYVDTHAGDGPSYLVEVVRGGHVSFTSCEIYDGEYGNGIGSRCPSLTRPGEMYEPLGIVEQHGMINTYGLAFLNEYLKPGDGGGGEVGGLGAIMKDGPFSKEELIVRSKL